MIGEAARSEVFPLPIGAVALLSLLSMVHCAPAQPLLAGGSTTPKRHAEIAAGAAVRVPTGELRQLALDPAPTRPPGNQGGVVPVALARYGVTAHADLGVMVTGSEARLSLRRLFMLHDGQTRWGLVLDATAFGGWFDGGNNDTGGGRGGGELPILIVAEAAGMYEFWFGLRAGGEGLRGDLAFDGEATPSSPTSDELRGYALRAGGVGGMGLGFRRFHVLLELSALGEFWSWSQPANAQQFGLVLVPAFAIRLRL